ncbi:uncharacterized protein LOC126892170 [Diabrotica virgifera virgifera]|uniref:BESS domain-containing protein n=1 Tax=Diabrotica virgifera virgifera TaxID=50390 RepID=A0ABM5L579_DIAVI|nr:uncharacterized protein LOC126892170 [Diabrotica virgifera virgifera]
MENVDEIEAEVSLSAQSQETSAPSSIDIPPKRSKRADEPSSSMMSNAFNILQNAADKLDTLKEKPNEINTFFTYAATKVINYSKETQTAVQQAVFEILMKADRGVYDSASSHHQHSWQNPPVNMTPSLPSPSSQSSYTSMSNISNPPESFE